MLEGLWLAVEAPLQTETWHPNLNTSQGHHDRERQMCPNS